MRNNILNMSKLLNSLKAKVKITEYRMSPYPRNLWICKGDTIKEAIKRFTLKGNGVWSKLEDFDDVEAVVFQVYENDSRELGYLVWLKDASEAAMVHEAGHVVLHLFEDINEAGIYDAQEPFCYMLEWVYGKIKESWYEL